MVTNIYLYNDIVKPARNSSSRLFYELVRIIVFKVVGSRILAILIDLSRFEFLTKVFINANCISYHVIYKKSHKQNNTK